MRRKFFICQLTNVNHFQIFTRNLSRQERRFLTRACRSLRAVILQLTRLVDVIVTKLKGTYIYIGKVPFDFVVYFYFCPVSYEYLQELDLTRIKFYGYFRSIRFELLFFYLFMNKRLFNKRYVIMSDSNTIRLY